MLRKPVGLCTFSSFLLFNEFSIGLQGRPAASGGEVGVRARSSCSCSCEAALRCHFTPLLGFQRWKGERFSLCVWRIVGYCSVMSQVFYRRLRFACANTSRPRGCEYNEGAGVSACISFIHKSKRCLDTKRCWSPDQSKAADRDMRSQKASFQSGIFLWCIVMCERNKDTWLQVPI